MTINIDLKLRAIKCYNNKLLNTDNTLKVFGISNGSLFSWIKKDKKGILTNINKRKRKIESHIRCYIKNYVITRINFNYRNLIRAIYKKYKIKISKSSIYNILKNFKIKKKKIYKIQMLMKRAKRKKLIIELKRKIKKVPLEDIISIDETSIDTYIDHNYGWGKKGIKIKVTKKKLRIRYTVICAITKNGVIHTKIIKNSANGEVFLEFIKDLIYKLKINKQKYLLMDNARIHHYKKLKEFINNNSNIDIIYNVPYSPEYNPIERVFNEAKNYLKNDNITLKNIKSKIKMSFNKIKKTNINNYYKKSLYHFY